MAGCDDDAITVEFLEFTREAARIAAMTREQRFALLLDREALIDH